MDINVLIVISLLAIILSSVTAIFSFLAYSRVVGMEKSTHQVQWMPIDEPNISQPTSDDPIDQDLEDRKRKKEMYSAFSKLYPDLDVEQV